VIVSTIFVPDGVRLSILTEWITPLGRSFASVAARPSLIAAARRRPAARVRRSFGSLIVVPMAPSP
jgi:hypothetical protein